MKNVKSLKKNEKLEINGGFGFGRPCAIPNFEDWDPRIIGWLDEGPNGDQHFPG